MARPGAHGTILKTIAILVVIEILVRGPFFDHFIMPMYGSNFDILGERTGGHSWAILFDALSRTPKHGVRIAVLGDSTLFAGEHLDSRTTIPFLLRQDL